MRRRYLSIRLQDWFQGQWLDTWAEFPCLFSVLDDGESLSEPKRKFYHGPGPSYQTLDMEHAKVEHDHGADYDVAVIAHARMWPPVKHPFGQDVPRCPGWIAPNGDFYPCRSWEHNGLAEHISLALWGKGITRLEKLGWIAVRSDVLGLPESITERQRTTLWAVWSSTQRVKLRFPEWQLSDTLGRQVSRIVQGVE